MEIDGASNPEISPRDPFDYLIADVWLIIAMDCPATLLKLTQTCQQLRKLLTDSRIVIQAKQKFAKRVKDIEDGHTNIYHILPNKTKHGTEKIWNDQGNIICLCNYIDGNLHGSFERWNNQGRLIYLAYYTNDKLHGTRKEWDDQGRLNCLCNYINGELHGTFEHWNDLERPMYYVAFYNNGQILGSYEIWNNSGRLIRESNSVYVSYGTYEMWDDRGISIHPC
jgi:antitoxin component YwqK of YwqJK toxin-antitoxin module